MTPVKFFHFVPAKSSEANSSLRERSQPPGKGCAKLWTSSPWTPPPPSRHAQTRRSLMMISKQDTRAKKLRSDCDCCHVRELRSITSSLRACPESLTSTCPSLKGSRTHAGSLGRSARARSGHGAGAERDGSRARGGGDEFADRRHGRLGRGLSVRGAELASHSWALKRNP